MMKKFEEYLEHRISDLKNQQETIKKNIAELENVGYDTAYSPSLNYAIGGKLELEKALNHFRQSAEAQSVADNECENKYCDCHDNPPVFMDYHINAQRCTKCGKET